MNRRFIRRSVEVCLANTAVLVNHGNCESALCDLQLSQQKLNAAKLLNKYLSVDCEFILISQRKLRTKDVIKNSTYGFSVM